MGHALARRAPPPPPVPPGPPPPPQGLPPGVGVALWAVGHDGQDAVKHLLQAVGEKLGVEIVWGGGGGGWGGWVGGGESGADAHLFRDA